MQLEAQVQAQLAAARLRRKRQARKRLLKRLAAAGLFALGLVWLSIGIVYAGSATTIASGISVAGVDVGGMSQTSAQLELQRRAATISHVRLPVHVGGRTFRLRPTALGVTPDWAGAAATAVHKGDGFGPVRGFRRLYVRAFGSDITPAARIHHLRLDAIVARLARSVDRPHRNAALRLQGLHPVVEPGATGIYLDRPATERAIVAAIVSLSREPIAAPTRSDPPPVTRATLASALHQARTAVSAPVQLRLAGTHLRLPRWRIAKILELPRNGAQALKIGGPAANAYFAQLQKIVNRAPKDAQFLPLANGRVRIAPALEGRSLDVPTTAKNIYTAALSPANRSARLVVGTAQPARTTAEAQAMGIKQIVSSYETFFGGVPNRISNVQLVSHLIDGTLIAPRHVFSFNATTGARTPQKGFKIAPVIINGELQNALGGGVCQVSTTVFNAAYEAGLDITARTNHALYISHYPQGRDATVDYPDVDLRFVNDTENWLLLRTWVSSSSLTVALYGTSPHRRVESTVAPLTVTGAPPVQRIKDPTLLVGKKVVDSAGSPALTTHVERKVYTHDGKLLYDNVWYSNYRGETRIVRIGTKPKPKPKPKAPSKPKVKPAPGLTAPPLP